METQERTEQTRKVIPLPRSTVKSAGIGLVSGATLGFCAGESIPLHPVLYNLLFAGPTIFGGVLGVRGGSRQSDRNVETERTLEDNIPQRWRYIATEGALGVEAGVSMTMVGAALGYLGSSLKRTFFG